jgi:hypothetical protein
MRFQRINYNDAEKVFAVFYNVAGATITSGYPACWDTSTADGIRVTKPATANLSLVVGLAAENIADSAYGKFQVYGYNSGGLVINATAQTLAAGDILVPVNAQWYLNFSAASNGLSGFLIAGESYASVTQTTLSASAAKKVFIRCL